MATTSLAESPKALFQNHVDTAPHPEIPPIERSDWHNDLFAEGAHGFIQRLRPHLAEWQQKTSGDLRYLQIGEPERLPPDDVFVSFQLAIEKRRINPVPFKYGSMTGPADFQNAFAEHTSRLRNQNMFYPYDLPPQHVIFTAGGSKTAYNMVSQEITNEKDDVLVLSPGYPGQFNAAKSARANMHGVPVRADNKWSTDADELKAVLDKHQPKRLYLCDPQNPTGGTFDEASIYTIADYLYTHPKAVAIVDVIYYGHVSDPDSYIMLSSIPEISEQVINVSGPSKILNATGLRAGVITIPKSQEHIVRAITSRANAENAGPSPFIGIALAEGYKAKMDKWIEEQRIWNKQKRDVCVLAAREYNPYFGTNNPPGAFYLVGDVPVDGYDFAFLASKFAGTAVLPAGVFGGGATDAEGKDLGGDTKKRIRISFAGNLEQTVGGIVRIGQLAKQIYEVGIDHVESKIESLKLQHGDDWINHVDFMHLIATDPQAKQVQN